MESKHTGAFAKADHILAEVREAEKKAEAIVSKARKESEAIISDARLEAISIIKHEEELLAREHEMKLAEVRQVLQASKDLDQRSIEKESEIIVVKASRKKEKAVEHILNSFEETIFYE